MNRESPSLAPSFDVDTYLVLDEITDARVYREADENEATRAKVIRNIADGQYRRPLRVVAFNTAEGWSRDVTEDIAREMLEFALRKTEPLSHSAGRFIERILDEDIPATIAPG
jgi:hypothetical protein